MSILEMREAIESNIPAWIPIVAGLALAVFAWHAGRKQAV
jgi:hypothetical protein